MCGWLPLSFSSFLWPFWFQVDGICWLKPTNTSWEHQSGLVSSVLSNFLVTIAVFSSIMESVCTNCIAITSKNLPSCCAPVNYCLSSSHNHAMLQRMPKLSVFSTAARSSTLSSIKAAVVTTTSGGRRSSSETNALNFNKSTSAMEQLDIERGVCVPFRKYTPDTVITISTSWHFFS